MMSSALFMKGMVLSCFLSCAVVVFIREFLTGFRKRKLERRKAALEEMKSKLKEEQKRVREEVRA